MERRHIGQEVNQSLLHIPLLFGQTNLVRPSSQDYDRPEDTPGQIDAMKNLYAWPFAASYAILVDLPRPQAPFEWLAKISAL
jgi:hypothetical protein